jgi:hypothetical protein
MIVMSALCLPEADTITTPPIIGQGDRGNDLADFSLHYRLGISPPNPFP